MNTSNDHTIPLDSILADAAQHLADEGMLAMASAVETARARLDGREEVDSEAALNPNPTSQVQLPLMRVVG